MKKLIDAYIYRITPKETIEFLLLLRSEKKIYSGQWRMVGGKVNDMEKHWQAALREIREETRMKPKKFWTIPSLNKFYEYQTDSIITIPAFAAEVENNAEPVLDAEHSTFQWIAVESIREYILWPEQRRLMNLVYDIVRADSILPQWNIPL